MLRDCLLLIRHTVKITPKFSLLQPIHISFEILHLVYVKQASFAARHTLIPWSAHSAERVNRGGAWCIGSPIQECPCDLPWARSQSGCIDVVVNPVTNGFGQNRVLQVLVSLHWYDIPCLHTRSNNDHSKERDPFHLTRC